MAKYLTPRRCPKCGNCFGVIIGEVPRLFREIPVTGLCFGCHYQIHWTLIRTSTTQTQRDKFRASKKTARADKIIN